MLPSKLITPCLSVPPIAVALVSPAPPAAPTLWIRTPSPTPPQSPLPSSASLNLCASPPCSPIIPQSPPQSPMNLCASPPCSPWPCQSSLLSPASPILHVSLPCSPMPRQSPPPSLTSSSPQEWPSALLAPPPPPLLTGPPPHVLPLPDLPRPLPSSYESPPSLVPLVSLGEKLESEITHGSVVKNKKCSTNDSKKMGGECYKQARWAPALLSLRLYWLCPSHHPVHHSLQSCQKCCIQRRWAANGLS